jgi:hypothetical protein
MQKISSYLLKNRIELVADLAGFATEWKIVYQRQVKIYSGIDNTLEFDIKNADQKRIDLTTLSNMLLNILDNQGNALPNSPYELVPTAITGIAAVTIPAADLAELEDQFFTYTVQAVKDAKDVILYGDTRFGASGVIELITTSFPKVKTSKVYDDFRSIGDFNNRTLTTVSSSVPLVFRDAIKPNHVHINVTLNNFIGTLWIELTKDTVIGNESYTYKGTRAYSVEYTDPQTGVISLPAIDITGYTYFRVNTTTTVQHTGHITSFTTEFHTHNINQPC